MDVYWSEHATTRFLERVVENNVTEEEVEAAVRKQRVRIKKGIDKKYKTKKFECIEKIQNTFITVQKAETKSMIHIITLWESKEREEKLWRRNTKKK